MTMRSLVWVLFLLVGATLVLGDDFYRAIDEDDQILFQLEHRKSFSGLEGISMRGYLERVPRRGGRLSARFLGKGFTDVDGTSAIGTVLLNNMKKNAKPKAILVKTVTVFPRAGQYTSRVQSLQTERDAYDTLFNTIDKRRGVEILHAQDEPVVVPVEVVPQPMGAWDGDCLSPDPESADDRKLILLHELFARDRSRMGADMKAELEKAEGKVRAYKIDLRACPFFAMSLLPEGQFTTLREALEKSPPLKPFAFIQLIKRIVVFFTEKFHKLGWGHLDAHGENVLLFRAKGAAAIDLTNPETYVVGALDLGHSERLATDKNGERRTAVGGALGYILDLARPIFTVCTRQGVHPGAAQRAHPDVIRDLTPLCELAVRPFYSFFSLMVSKAAADDACVGWPQRLADESQRLHFTEPDTDVWTAALWIRNIRGYVLRLADAIPRGGTAPVVLRLAGTTKHLSSGPLALPSLDVLLPALMSVALKVDDARPEWAFVFQNPKLPSSKAIAPLGTLKRYQRGDKAVIMSPAKVTTAENLRELILRGVDTLPGKMPPSWAEYIRRFDWDGIVPKLLANPEESKAAFDLRTAERLELVRKQQRWAETYFQDIVPRGKSFITAAGLFPVARAAAGERLIGDPVVAVVPVLQNPSVEAKAVDEEAPTSVTDGSVFYT